MVTRRVVTGRGRQRTHPVLGEKRDAHCEVDGRRQHGVEDLLWRSVVDTARRTADETADDHVGVDDEEVPHTLTRP